MRLVTLFSGATFITTSFVQGEKGEDIVSALVLKPENVNTASQSTGQNGTFVQNWGDSKTDSANFINYCTGKTLTNGQQNKAGSCNGIVMGDLPSFTNMISSIILSPTPGQILPPSRDIMVRVSVQNLALGHVTTPQRTYYTAPQSLSATGLVVGHVHITVQDMGGNLTPVKPLDATKFVIFKGVDDTGNGQGEFQTTIKGGLPRGYYRLCTMTAAMNHQPVLMPVAQRGAQDDCQKFIVGGSGGRGEENDDAERRRKEEAKEAHIASEGERARRGKGRVGDGRRM